MDRLEILREHIDKLLMDNPDTTNRRCGFVHLYGVAQAAVIIAKKRELNPELAAMSGMLHDIYTHTHQYCDDHAQKGAIMARNILGKLAITESFETDIICSAIANHSDKDIINGDYDEVLKDADVMQHCTYNPNFEIKKHEQKRYTGLCYEFCLFI